MPGALVLIDQRNDQAHHLNETASWVWQACDGHKPLEAIAGELTAIYEVSNTQAYEDVCQIINHLLTLGILQIQPAD